MGHDLWRLKARRKDPRRAGRVTRERLLEGTFADAKKERARLVLELELEAAPKSARVPFRVYSESWLASRAATVSVHTAKHYALHLAQQINPFLGDFYLDKLTRDDVQRWINGQVGKVARETIRTRYRVFRSVWASAMADHAKQVDDVTTGIRFPTAVRKDEADTNALTADQLRTFLAGWAGKKDEAMIWMLATLGARWCHVSGMKWSDLDRENKRIRILRAHVRGVISPINVNKKAPSSLPVDDEVLTRLEAHRIRLIKRDVPNPDGWLFPSHQGTPKLPSSIRKEWAKVAKAAGISHRFSVHGLRRTFNDLMREAGVDGVVIRAFTGHSSDTMREHYSSVGHAEQERTVGKLLQLVKS